MECQVRQLDLLDIQLRWLLHCAMKLVWDTKGDPRPRYILAEGLHPLVRALNRLGHVHGPWKALLNWKPIASSVTTGRT